MTKPQEEDRMGGTATEDTRGISSPKIVAVIPAYNEERFIGSVVLRTRQYADAVVVVDDGSTDATAEIAAAAGAIVARHEHNRGKAAALNSGLRKAQKLRAEAVALLDGDWQHRPDDIPQMIRPVVEGQADMVMGSRYLGLESRIPAYRTRNEARTDIFYYIESFYNRQRLHSSLDYLSPEAY